MKIKPDFLQASLDPIKLG